MLTDTLHKHESCLNQLVTDQQDTVMIDIEETPGDKNQSDVITLKSPIEHLASSIVNEQNEKEKQQLNIVANCFVQYPESVQDEARTRKQEDIDRVSSLLNKYLSVKASIIMQSELAKRRRNLDYLRSL